MQKSLQKITKTTWLITRVDVFRKIALNFHARDHIGPQGMSDERWHLSVNYKK